MEKLPMAVSFQISCLCWPRGSFICHLPVCSLTGDSWTDVKKNLFYFLFFFFFNYMCKPALSNAIFLGQTSMRLSSRMEPVGVAEQCRTGPVGTSRLSGAGRASRAYVCPIPQHKLQENNCNLINTAADSPLELLEENSNVHAPLGVEQGNLRAGTDKR